MADRFPTNDTTGEKTNAAIQLYGRRFYSDQTPVEYLAEFLLVFASPKGSEAEQSVQNSFSFSIGKEGERVAYFPEDRIALKLFAFFPTSKLDTRHPAHQRSYREALHDLSSRIEGGQDEIDDTIRLLQGLLAGFVGVSNNRTWATQTFLPATNGLLARELDWLHSKASRDPQPTDWDGARQFFAADRHNFLARGGELLFLQIAHLFTTDSIPLALSSDGQSYRHLDAPCAVETLRSDLAIGLRGILESAASPLDQMTRFLERALSSFKLYDGPKRATLGWVPTATISESYLFAWEMRNIVSSDVPDLEKLDLMQLLCCMQVLRTLCSQAARQDVSARATSGFSGGYSWVLCSPDASAGSAVRKLAQSSFEKIEEMLFRVLRRRFEADPDSGGSLTEADKHGFQIFRRLGKQLGLVIPRTGKGQRFVLPPHLLRFLVVALLRPGERIRLNRFFERVFAHYGIALGDQQLAVALAWGGAQSEGRDYAVAADTRWIEETLRQGGLLVELSDAVSMVQNPGGRQDDR